MPIAASVTEGSRVNAGDPESFGSAWLDQPVDPFHVDRLVEPGEMLDTGVVRLRVVPAAGHSLGQIALFEDRSRVLIAGDAILASDVAWINPFLDGGAALEVAIATLERIGLLDAHVYLRARRWVHDFAPLAGLPSREFAERVVSDLLRSGAACWQDDRLISTVPHSRVGS